MRRIILVLALAMTTLLLTIPASAWASTFTVTNTSDAGDGSLREAISNANTNAGADEINFADGGQGTITLNSTLPEITDPAGLTIGGGQNVTVSGNNAVRVLKITQGAKLNLNNLKVVDGNIVSEGGGGIYNQGMLEVINSAISGNFTRSPGGGIYNNRGTLKIIDSTISGNTALNTGGGIFNDGGSLEVAHSTISSNSGSGAGGILSYNGPMTVNSSTIFGNRAQDGFGGGIVIGNNSGYGTPRVEVKSAIFNSTVSGNTASTFGGGISNIEGSVEVTNSTISGNNAPSGGNIFTQHANYLSPVLLSNTIVANSTSGSNCSGRGITDDGYNGITDGGYNVEDGNSCTFTQGSGSLSNTDPLLDPAGLQDNGGPTETIALQPESPAVDLVGSGACPPPETDQRGVERPQGAACDSGAFELEAEESPLPTTKELCKHGGYERFGFQNQSQCIKAVKKAR